MDQQQDMRDIDFEQWFDEYHPPFPIPLDVLYKWHAEDQLQEQDEQAEIYWLELRSAA